MNKSTTFENARVIDPAVFLARLDYQQCKQQPTQNAHGVHIGDLFYASWGYDQTNIDFYQVVALKGKATAVIREIRGERIPGGDMHGDTRPIRDDFASEETYTRRTRIGYSGHVEIGSPRFKGHAIWPTNDDTLHDYSCWS